MLIQIFIGPNKHSLQRTLLWHVLSEVEGLYTGVFGVEMAVSRASMSFKRRFQLHKNRKILKVIMFSL